MQLANKIDLESILGFSKGEKQSAEVQEETVSKMHSVRAMIASLIL